MRKKNGKREKEKQGGSERKRIDGKGKKGSQGSEETSEERREQQIRRESEGY